MAMFTSIVQIYLLSVWFLLRPRQSTAFSNAPLSIQEELGCSPTLSFLLQREKDDVYFDPLGLATDENFARYREAELKHGRVAMVSVVASVASSIRHNDNIVDVASYLTKGIPVPSLYQLLHEWTLSDVATFVLLCGFLETIIFVQLNPQDMPGDYGFGYWGVRDKGKNERSLVCELENGRLSMMVVLYYLLHDVLVHPFYREFWERSVANIMGQQ